MPIPNMGMEFTFVEIFDNLISLRHKEMRANDAAMKLRNAVKLSYYVIFLWTELIIIITLYENMPLFVIFSTVILFLKFFQQ